MSQWGSEAQHTSSRVTKKLVMLSLLASCAVIARALLASREVEVHSTKMLLYALLCVLFKQDK